VRVQEVLHDDAAHRLLHALAEAIVLVLHATHRHETVGAVPGIGVHPVARHAFGDIMLCTTAGQPIGGDG
jgi:hypothetical protein